VANFIANQSVCADNRTAAITFTSSLPNTTYSWFNTEPGIGLSAFGTGNIPSFLATNNTSGQLTGNIQVTPSVSGCTGPTVTAARIVVNRAIRSTLIEASPAIACEGQTVGPFVGSVPLGGDGYNYLFQWQSSVDNVNFTNIPGAVSRQLNAPAVAASTWFRMNTTSGGCAASTPAVFVQLKPKPVITVSNNDGFSVSQGNSTQVFVTGGISYVWTPRDQVDDYTSPNPMLTPKNIGVTTFNVFVTNAEGCSDTAPVNISVIEGFQIFPNNIITPNGDGYNDTWRIKNLEFYKNNKITIYNTQSVVVKTLENYDGTSWGATHLNGGKLPSGTYYYVIILNPDTSPVTKKGFVTVLN